MAFHKVNSTCHAKLDYYVRNDNSDSVNDQYVLLGFKDNLSVLRNDMPTKRDTPEDTDSRRPSTAKVLKLNGQKLKVVPPSEIPETIRQSALRMLKKPQPVVNKATGGLVSNNAATVPKLLFKTPSRDKDASAGDKSLSKLEVGANIEPVPDKDTSSVNPTVADASTHCSSVRRMNKLLCAKTLDTLNQIKMKALNLSRKPTLPNGKQVTNVGVQTELLLVDQMVQTETDPLGGTSPYSMYNDFDTAIHCPIINDVSLGTGPAMEKVWTSSAARRTIGMPVYLSTEQNMLQKKLFHQDLNKCFEFSSEGNLPLHDGIINNQISIVKRQCVALKARQIGVNTENHFGCTSLQLAIIENADVEIVYTLLKFHKGEISDVDGDGNSILHLATKLERRQILEALLSDERIGSNSKLIDAYNFEGLTPLMISCMSGWIEGVQLLIAFGANVNLRDQTSGRTALFHAAEIQNVDIVITLLTNDADTKIKNFFGTSPHDAMYELDDMPDTIKNLIFGKSRKRTIEAEMNPAKTAKAAKTLKMVSKLQKIQPLKVNANANMQTYQRVIK